MLSKRKIMCGILTAVVGLAGMGWAVTPLLAGKPDNPAALKRLAKAPRPSKLDLTPGTFAQFRDLVRPGKKEWRHLKVRWITDIVAARKKAAQEDKPIVIFRTGGAGYNDPMGVC